MEKTAKKKTWMKFRHRVVRDIAYVILWPYCRLRYGIRIQRFRQQENRPYLILLNHQTPFDQFFAGMAFKGPVYYMATEDIFSMGWLSNVIRWLVAPIPIKKQTTDIQAVMNCMRIAKEGGTICIAPEGNRTYSGRSVYMNPAIAPLAKKLNLPVALFRIEGGYGAEPRWSDVVRRGKMRAYVSEVIQPEELAELSKDELYARIRDGLDVREDCVGDRFFHKKNAQYLERALYVCTECGLTTFESDGDLFVCRSCGRQVRYLPTKELEGIGWACPFRFVYDWYEYQCDFINKLDLTAYREKALYQEQASVSEVIVYERKDLLSPCASVALYGDRITIDKMVFLFDQTAAVTVLGRNKLNIYHDKKVYQIKGDKRFNALKYVNFFHRYKNISKGDIHAEFLGL